MTKDDLKALMVKCGYDLNKTNDLAKHNIEERLYCATQFTTFGYEILNRLWI